MKQVLSVFCSLSLAFSSLGVAMEMLGVDGLAAGVHISGSVRDPM